MPIGYRMQPGRDLLQRLQNRPVPVEHPLLQRAKDPNLSLEELDQWLLHEPRAHALTDGGGTTLLMHLAFHGNARTLMRALNAPGATPQALDHHERTALMAAAASGDPQRIALLLPLSDPRQVSVQGETALMKACSSTARSACLDLLIPGSDPLQTDMHGSTALMLASSYGDPAMVRRLLPVSDPTQVDEAGLNALMRAAQTGQAGTIALLLPVSDLTTATTVGGYTALMLAAVRRESGMVEPFLKPSPATTALRTDVEQLGKALQAALLAGQANNARLLAMALPPDQAMQHLRNTQAPHVPRLMEIVAEHERTLLRAMLPDDPETIAAPRHRTRL